VTYPEIIQSIATSLNQSFDEVYHSAEIVINDKNEKFVGVAKNDDWIKLSPTDQKETLYIRRNGDDQIYEELRITSCSKSYKMRSQLRIVYYKQQAEKHEEILFKLMQSILIQGTKLDKIIRDKNKLFKDESSGNYSFGPKTCYFGIDVFVIWQLSDNSCEQDFCTTIDNPLKKC
jgi:hypothetical protein